MNEPITVSIIGSAGRGCDFSKMDGMMYRAMKKKCKYIIEEEWKLKPSQVHLVSGGSAWSDHVAVDLFLGGRCSCCSDEKDDHVAKMDAYAGLTLHLPCVWDEKKCEFVERHPTMYAAHGKRLNFLHRRFSFKAGMDSLKQIQEAKKCGATFHCGYRNFFERNAQVAQSQRLIAFSWSDAEVPMTGGTCHTWSCCPLSTLKIHVPLKCLGSFDTSCENENK